MRITIVIMVALSLLGGGCSGSYGPDGDHFYNLIADLQIAEMEPAQYTTSGPMNLVVVCESRYAGRGRIQIIGSGDDPYIGVLLSPVQAALGTASWPLDLPDGRLEIPLTILMATDVTSVVVSVMVSCDSLLAGESIVDWLSPEGRAVYEEDIPPYCVPAVLNNQAIQLSIARAPIEVGVVEGSTTPEQDPISRCSGP